MKWVWMGIAVLAVLVAGAMIANRPTVSVKSLDPNLHIRNAWVSHWSTSTNMHWEAEHWWLRVAKSFVLRYERKWGLTKAYRPNYTGPCMSWNWSPGYWECDQLVLFGTCDNAKDLLWLADLCDTNGAHISGGGELARALDRVGFITNDFGYLLGIPTNLHGPFLLRTREGTNVAVVTIH